MSEIEPQYGVVAVVSAPQSSFAVEVLQLDKTGILNLAQNQVNDAAENGEDTIRITAQAAKMELYAKTVKDLSKKKSIEEVGKYGKGGIMREGVVFTSSTSTEYDYSEDVEWQRLNAIVEEAKEKLKDHQDMLKKLPADGKMMLDESTGEMYRAYRPVRLVSDTIKATIK